MQPKTYKEFNRRLNQMHLLFPSDPFNKSAVDEVYEEELVALVALGFTYSLFSFEDFEAGEFKARPAFPIGEEIIYRGWMVTPETYARLYEAVANRGGVLKTNSAQYRRCHYLPEWYEICADVTPETITTHRDADFVIAVAGRNWPGYFVKDYVKSLTTQRGSVAARPEDIAEVVSLIEQYRGTIEGGVCIRKFEYLISETEERYFVLDGKAHGRDGIVPTLVEEIAQRIKSPFFSIDTVSSDAGQLRLIELGDGQVSDRKKWTAQQFASMLRGH
jgi:hypothetical protein